MANRIWFYASEGQQKGPFPEAQFRVLIAQGTVTADTLVWAEGMAGWQKAGEVPGLMAAPRRSPCCPMAAATAEARYRWTCRYGRSWDGKFCW